jgi:hypothetical protein
MLACTEMGRILIVGGSWKQTNNNIPVREAESKNQSCCQTISWYTCRMYQKVVEKGLFDDQKLLPYLCWQEMTPTFEDGRRVTLSGT